MVVNNEIIYVYVFASARPVDGVSGIMFCCCLSICMCVHICMVIFVHTICTNIFASGQRHSSAGLLLTCSF